MADRIKTPELLSEVAGSYAVCMDIFGKLLACPIRRQKNIPPKDKDVLEDKSVKIARDFFIQSKLINLEYTPLTS